MAAEDREIERLYSKLDALDAKLNALILEVNGALSAVRARIDTHEQANAHAANTLAAEQSTQNKRIKVALGMCLGAGLTGGAAAGPQFLAKIMSLL